INGAELHRVFPAAPEPNGAAEAPHAPGNDAARIALEARFEAAEARIPTSVFWEGKEHLDLGRGRFSFGRANRQSDCGDKADCGEQSDVADALCINGCASC